MDKKVYLQFGRKEQASDSLLSSQKSSFTENSEQERIKAIDQAYLEWKNINFYVPHS